MQNQVSLSLCLVKIIIHFQKFSIMAKKEKSAKVIAVSNLIAANKETKTLSGVIKLVQKFWTAGYREAFQYVGINKMNDLNFELIAKGLHSSCYLSGKAAHDVKVAKKDAKGNFIMTSKNGKECKEYEKVRKVIDKWTPRILFDLLLESKEANEAAITEAAPIPTGKATPSKKNMKKGAKAA